MVVTPTIYNLYIYYYYYQVYLASLHYLDILYYLVTLRHPKSGYFILKIH